MSEEVEEICPVCLIEDELDDKLYTASDIKCNYHTARICNAEK
jgi:hypothetical protein